MMSSDYISKIRQKIGHQHFIHPGARILVENEQGEFLFIKRRDNGKLGLPGGGLEENETIRECITREVKEETGIEILDVEVIGISTDPNNETVQYPNNDVIQYFTIEFYSKKWKGSLQVQDQKEVVEAKWLPKEFLNHLPNNEKSIIHSLDQFRKDGRVILK